MSSACLNITNELDRQLDSQSAPSTFQMSNRQQAILSLVHQEISSAQELQNKLYYERQRRETAELTLLAERVQRHAEKVQLEQAEQELIQLKVVDLPSASIEIMY
jgi:hypothetical protein